MFGAMKARTRGANEASALHSTVLDNRIVAVMRLVLAASGLIIILIDPSEPSRFVVSTYLALSLYVAHSVVLCVSAFRSVESKKLGLLQSHWWDVAWYVLLIALSRGTSSIFFFGFFFAILVASFREGFASGFRTTCISVFLFSTVGFVTAPSGDEFELNRFLIRPIYLLVLGYMMSYWGGFEIKLKRRLDLLREVTVLSNPRFGVDRTITMLMERVQQFYGAQGCIIVTIKDAQAHQYHIHQSTKTNTYSQPLAPNVAHLLLALPPTSAVVYWGHQWWHWLLHASEYQAYDTPSGQRIKIEPERLQSLTATLETCTFVSVPVYYHTNIRGRAFLLSNTSSFDSSDPDFLLQLTAQVIPVIDNIQLVDQLASSAAEEERRRIARNLHDSVIQPYIGLQMGLNAVRQKLIRGELVTSDVDRLITIVDDEVGSLRSYVGTLKNHVEHEESLVPSIRRFAEKFTIATGITISINTAPDLAINDRLAAELFQMVAEALSNIRRHTQATHAEISLTRHGNTVMLNIANKADDGSSSTFVPKSITERAGALGGRALVTRNEQNQTIVNIAIPL
jgi:signal transduction histidine kinase